MTKEERNKRFGQFMKNKKVQQEDDNYVFAGGSIDDKYIDSKPDEYLTDLLVKDSMNIENLMEVIR